MDKTEALTVAELAVKHGQARDPAVSEDSGFSRDHLGADAAHGWKRHKHFHAQDVRLSDEDYLAAIDAFRDGKTHAPANMRPLTVHTDEQKDAMLAAAKAAPKISKPVPRMTQAHARALTMARAHQLANAARKVRG